MTADGASGSLWPALFLLAGLAVAVHLAARDRSADLPRPLAFVASAYLAGFFFLASAAGIARFLQLFGIQKDLSGLIAVPLGLVLALRLHAAYEKWRLHRRNK